MEIQAVSASKRKTHVPEMQFHMRVVVSEIEETDSHVSPGQLLYKNEGVRTSIGAELVAAAALSCAGALDAAPDPPQAAREIVIVAARRSAISLFMCYLPLVCK